MTLAGLVVCAFALFGLRQFVAAGAPESLRVGPWPGLTLRGSQVILSVALLLAGSQLAIGPAEVDLAQRSAVPYVPLATLGGVAASLVTARITRLPATVSAVCGAYLLPRSLVALLLPWVAPPAQMLPAAMALDLVLWLRPADVPWLMRWLPFLAPSASEPDQRVVRPVTRRRATLGGALFGLLLGLFEPAQALAIGAPAEQWSLGGVLTATLLAAIVGASAAWFVGGCPWPPPWAIRHPRGNEAERPG